MPRVALVVCLIVCLLVSGCISARSTIAEWEPLRALDDRPVLKGCAYCAIAVGVAAVIVGVALANGWLDDQDHYHRRHPAITPGSE